MHRKCHDDLPVRLICVNCKFWLGWGGSREKLVDYPKLKGLILWNAWIRSVNFIVIIMLEFFCLFKCANERFGLIVAWDFIFKGQNVHSKFHGNLASSHWTINQHSNPPTDIFILITFSTRAMVTLLQVCDIYANFLPA